MRVRASWWPGAMVAAVAWLCCGLTDLSRVAHRSTMHSVWSVLTSPMGVICLGLWLGGWTRRGVRLEPTGLRRWSGGATEPIPWRRIRAVALTGDPWAARPTVWTDSGHEIALDELAGSRWTLRRAERNTARITAYWHIARGADWVPAAWAGDGPPWSWQPGERWARRGDRQRVAPAAWVGAAWAAVLVVTGWVWWWVTGQRTERSVAGVAGWLLLEVLGAWLLAGLVVGPLGLSRRGRRDQTSWARVQSIELCGGRWFARPVLRTDDGERVSLWGQGVVFGCGRRRARRVTTYLEGQWIARRGVQWQPVPVPAAAR